MTTRLSLACALLLSAASARADDVFYHLDPETWTLYSLPNATVTRLPTTVTCPDGATKVHPFQCIGTARCDVGPSGYDKGHNYQTGLHVAPGGLDEYPMFYRWLSGGHSAHLCVDGNITGYATHQCMDYDGQTGVVAGTDPAIAGHSIPPFGGGWRRPAIIFRTAKTFEYGDQAFAYVQHAPGTFALCSGHLVTGHAP